MSILSRLQKYSSLSPSRWHTPGHKGTLDPLDITELADGSFPAESVRAAEAKAARFYHARRARFLTGGSSMGIKAAILAAGGDIIAPQSRHRSVYEGAELAKVKLYTFRPEIVDGLPNVPSLADVEAALAAYPRAKAVYLESPDYFGRVIDPAILDAVKKAGMLFFCDAAHGAHFPAHPGLFPKSYSGIADACNLSAHKTLDAYTQSAYLCVNDGNESLIGGVDRALELLGTTSPSYLLLASLETAIENAQNNKAEYERLYRDCAAFRKEIPCLKNDDFSRLCVDAGAYGLTGAELGRKLSERNIYAEKYQGNYAVFIAAPHDKTEDIERLAAAIKKAELYSMRIGTRANLL